DMPHVPKAEQTSNMIAIRETSSVKDKRMTEVTTSSTAKPVTTKDFNKSSSWISRLKTLMIRFPLANWKKNKIFRAKVVVRIPPPTELGEAPINIKIAKSNKVAVDNSCKSSVTSLALRVDTD